MLGFLSGLLPLQRKDHVIRTFKKALASLPAHPAFAMLQSDKLSLHFSPTRWTDFATAFLLKDRRRAFRRLWFIWKPTLLNTGFILRESREKLLVHFVIGNPYASGDYFLIYFVRERGHRCTLGYFPMLPVILAHRLEHPIGYFGFVLLSQIRICPIGLRLFFVRK